MKDNCRRGTGIQYVQNNLKIGKSPIIAGGGQESGTCEAAAKVLSTAKKTGGLCARPSGHFPNRNRISMSADGKSSPFFRQTLLPAYGLIFALERS